MQLLAVGAIAALSGVAALFFLRFWWQSRDRFFLWFALSFGLEGLNRALLGGLLQAGETEPLFYGVRLVSYALILLAVWQKNRG